MKHLITFLSVTVLLVSVSCTKMDIKPAENANSSSPETVAGRPEVYPSISNVSAPVGFNTAYASNSFGGYYKADLNNGTYYTITGNNFGNTQGTSVIYFEKYSNGSWTLTSSYTLRVTSWSYTQIKVKLQTNLNSLPIATARFRVVVVGLSGISSSFSTVPYIWGRQYEQCTWWVSKRTIENGFPGSNATYANVASSISPYYVPTANDLLSWGANVHEAYIESVTVSYEANNVTKYYLRISEANVAWSGNGYSTAPTTYYTTVKVQNNGGVKSFVAGYNKYRSTRVDGALYYLSQ